MPEPTRRTLPRSRSHVIRDIKRDIAEVRVELKRREKALQEAEAHLTNAGDWTPASEYAWQDATDEAEAYVAEAKQEEYEG
jgi:Arc/MetJ-type ribon-helix-helix transcriptional regulator